jgi:hypothetical protein
MLNKAYLAIGGVIIACYALAEFSGWEFGNTQRQVVPGDVRHSPGGYRSFHFWHSGFRGGK